jgi:uncharacterized protein YjiK
MVMKKVFQVVVLMLTVWLPLPFYTNVAKASITPANNLIKEGERNEGKVSLNKWELPSILTRVSGIKYLGNSRFACIQEEVGTIFIYNTASGRIEKEIPFSGPGDFEGIAIVGTAAYVVQSNGKIYEVQDYEGVQPIVKQYTMPLAAKYNVEGLTYDKNNSQLLLAIKGGVPRNHHYKGVYAFDLRSKRPVAKPVIKINLNDPFFTSIKENKANHSFQPSAIEIHPLTKEIYILQGTADPKLLVMDAKGRIKKMYTFRRSEFPQATGLAFTPAGELFISNEGENGAATIVKVTL